MPLNNLPSGSFLEKRRNEEEGLSLGVGVVDVVTEL